MKIISVACHNINSLRGKEAHRLDFEAAPLDNCGLFAITGPTGAGKTTLLDAITLALYGRTPRQSNSRALISHGAKESWAEVVYEVAAGRFLTRWSIQSKRTHKKPGDSLRDAHMEVSSWPDGKLLAQKTEKTIAQNEALTGMKYGQFTRSVLLAQGGFDEFLKAKDDEREKLLERITGIEIYTTLSGQAHDRHRIEEQKEKDLLAQLGAVQWLTSEELDQKTTQAAELAETVGQAAAAAEALRQQHEWHEKLADLTRKADQAAEALVEAEAARTARQADLDRLAAHEQAEPFEQRWRLATAAADEARRAETERQQLAANGIVARARHTDAVQAVAQAKAALDTAKQNLRREKPALDEALAQVRKLETLAAAATIAQADWQREEHDRQAAANEYTAFSEKTATETDERTRLEGWLKAHEADAKLEGIIARIENLLLQRAEAVNECSKISKERREPQAAFEAAVIAERDHARNAEQANFALTELVTEIEQGQQQYAGLEQAARQRKPQLLQTLEELQRGHARLHEQLLGKKLFAQHANALQPGHHCPLCGALEHPVLLTGLDVSAEAIAALEAEVATARQQVESLTSQQQQNDALLTRLESLPVSAIPDVAAMRLPLAFAQQEAKRLLTELKDAPIRQNNLKHAADQARKNQSDAQERQAELRKQLDQYAAELAEATAKGSRITQQINDQTTLLGLVFDRKQPGQLVLELEQRATAYARQAELFKELGLALAGASARRTELEKQLQERALRCTQLQAKFKEAEVERDACAATIRGAHPGYASPQAALAHWQQAQDAAQLAWEVSQDQERKYSDEVNKLAEQEKEKASRRELAEQDHEHQLNELSQLLPAAGLSASSAILDQLLPEAERPVLRKLQADLTGRVTQAAAHGQWCAQELETTHQLALTTEPAEEVKAAFAAAQQHHVALRDQLIGLNKDLTDDQAKREKHAVLGQELAAQKAESRRWAAMYELLGSKERSKFGRFAQGLTLAHLVTLANHHLRQFNDRYELRRHHDVQSLGLQVADSYDDCLRDVGTLSGGETFLVSLALALGLSELASNSARIDSLFIDEGFGTLDADTLDVALAALGSLRQRGKTIGIITHVDVDRLKDYIDTRIVVERVGQGSSRLRVLPEVAVEQPV